MDKVKISSNAFLYPFPVTLVGTMVGAKPSFMAVSWITRANYQPPLVVCCLGKMHATIQGIEENKCFSVCIPSVKLVKKTDYCGVVSASRHDKSDVFEIFYGELKKAPMAVECPLCMECELVKSVPLTSNILYIGEIKGAYSEEKYLTAGAPDIEKIKPFVLSMPDNRYWEIGKPVGKAWSDGLGKERD
jgi:flavin reductase (DIM6/NTAB) family NADH-FMN oxidoreductase RutF